MPRGQTAPRQNKPREASRYRNRDPCRNHCALAGFKDDIRTAWQIKPGIAIMSVPGNRQALFKQFDFNLWRHTQVSIQYPARQSKRERRDPEDFTTARPVCDSAGTSFENALVSTMAGGISLLCSR